MIFLTYDETITHILDLPRFTKKNEPAHTREFMRQLGNPQESFHVIHVAGSNGKGSVCAYIDSVLTEAGFSTGLFTSPHLIDIRERFRLNGKMCSQKQFMEAENKVRQAVGKMQEKGLAHPTFFEYIFAVAMIIFVQAGVSHVILETGLGGRLDATNVVKHPQLTVITSLSLEHSAILGDTIEKIAFEKAGIIKQGVPVIFDGSEPAANEVIQAVAKKRNAPVTCIYPDNIKILLNTGKRIDFCLNSGYDYSKASIPFGAVYQARNGGLALAAVKYLQKKLPICDQHIEKGFANVKWAGRMEEILPGIYLDGAHNLSGIHALTESVKEMTQEPAILLFSMFEGKEYEASIQWLCDSGCFTEIIVTTMTGDARAVPGSRLEALFLKYKGNDTKVLYIEEPEAAFRKGKEDRRSDQYLFCAGSLYLIGELKKIVGGFT